MNYSHICTVRHVINCDGTEIDHIYAGWIFMRQTDKLSVGDAMP